MGPNSVYLCNIPFIPLISSKILIFDRCSGDFCSGVLVVVVLLPPTVKTRAIVTTPLVPV